MFAIVVNNLAFAGSLNDTTLLAVQGLANTCSTIMVLSIVIGLNSAEETLVSQAFAEGNLKLCGVYLNRGRLILTAFFVPLAFILATTTENILLAIGIDSEVSRLT